MASRLMLSLTLSLALLVPGIFAAIGEYRAPPAVHYPLKRREGAFALNRTADLDELLEQLAAVEQRFNLTSREVRGNRVVRVPREGPEGGPLTEPMGEVGRNGSWFVRLRIVYGGKRWSVLMVGE